MAVMPDGDMIRLGARGLLDLADDLASLTERFDHLLTLLPPSDGEIALLQQIIKGVGPVHVL